MSTRTIVFFNESPRTIYIYIYIYIYTHTHVQDFNTMGSLYQTQYVTKL